MRKSLRQVQAVTRLLSAIAAFAVAGTLTGCQTSQTPARELAERDWNGQRAALKSELASAELKRGRVDSAVHLAATAAGLAPRDPAHAEVLARAYMARGDFAAAREVLLLVRKTAKSAAIDYLLGTVYEREQRWADAIEAFRAAAAAAPDNLAYRLALADTVLQSGDVSAALHLLPADDVRFGSEPEFHAARAALLRRAERIEEACEAYRRALQLGGEDADLRRSLGLCLTWIGRRAEARPHLEAALRSDRAAEPAVMVAYATILLSTGEDRLALQWLRRFTEDRPDVGDLWILLAQAHLAVGDSGGATQAASRALTLMPQSGEALCMAAAAWLAAGQPAKAERLAKDALTLDPQDETARLISSRAAEALKRGSSGRP